MSLSEHALILTFLAFASTSIDDFSVVTIFFAREYVKDRPKSERDWAFFYVAIGQILGFSIIVGISLGIGIGLSETISNGYIDLIGFLPLALGVYKGYEVMEEDGYVPNLCDSCCCGGSSSKEEDSEPASERRDSFGPLGKETSPLLLGLKNLPSKSGNESDGPTSMRQLSARSQSSLGHHKRYGKGSRSGRLSARTATPDPSPRITTAREDEEQREEGQDQGSGSKDDGQKDEKGEMVQVVAATPTPTVEDVMAVILDEETVEEFNDFSKNSAVLEWFRNVCACWLHPLTIEVMLYALMFGTDNIAVYVALFADVTESEAFEIVGIFYAMLFGYLALSMAIVLNCPSVARFVGDHFKYIVPLILIGLGIYIIHGSVIWADSDDV